MIKRKKTEERKWRKNNLGVKEKKQEREKKERTNEKKWKKIRMKNKRKKEI